MTKTGKNIIVINTGSVNQKFIFQRLKQLGHKVTVACNEVNWAAPFVHDWIIVDTKIHDTAIRKVSDYAYKYKVDGILTFTEDDVLLTSKIIDKCDLIGNSYNVASKARNKLQFRTFCQKYNLPTPQFIAIHDLKDLAEVKEKFKFPVVIKPSFGNKGAYVIKADDSEELREVYEFVKKNLANQIEMSSQEGLSIMVEEYIDGDEVDIDIVLQNGKIKFYSISDNYQTKEPFFIETGQAIPTVLPQTAQQKLIDMAEEILERLNIESGCIHFESKFTEKGPIPIEINLRMGGNETWTFVKKAWRVDLIELAVNVACDVYIPKIVKKNEPYAYLAGKYFLADKSGILSQLEYAKKFDDDLDVDDFYFFKHIGDAVFTPPAEYEALGWISAVGNNANDARDNLETACEEVDFKIIPFTSTSTVGKTQRVKPEKSAYLGFRPSDFKRQAKIEKLRFMNLNEQRQLNIGIACNTYTDFHGTIESDLSSIGQNIEKTLNDIGYKTTFLDFNDLDKAISTLQKNKVDLVFNVCERINNSSLLEPHVAAIFDSFQIPYTGSNPFTLGLCIDKIRVKKLLTYHNIPTAKWDYLYDIHDEVNEDLKFPIIVKPGNTDNSIGISNDSVVTNKKQLKQQIEYVILDLNRPVLLEEYLEGDEYGVSIIGSEGDDIQVLPLSRYSFNMPKGKWNILSFDFKFGPDNPIVNIQRPPKNVSKKLLSLISEIALDTYNILDCHDYGRVDVKLDRDGNPYVLELNPNPSIGEHDCVPDVARIDGYNYGEFLEKIIALAIKRYKNRPPYYHLQSNML